MKKLMLGLFVTTSMMVTSCSDDDDNGNVVGVEETTTYNLTSSTSNETVGNVTLQRNSDNSTTAMVEMDDAMQSGETRTVYLNEGPAANPGQRAITLNEIDATTGMSNTTFTTFDDGSPVTYEQLMAYDGHVSVHSNDQTESMAYADIGTNQLTGESRTYQLRSETGNDGTITFERRMNNTSLATVNMNNTTSGNTYPVRMYNDNSIDGDTPVFQMNAVNGMNGMSRTQVDMFDDGTEMDYDGLMDYDGHVRVHGDNNMTSDVAYSDIGQNELTGNFQTYNLDPVGTSNVGGTLRMEERMNGETAATMQLDNTVDGVNHAATMNSGVAGTTGDQLGTFNNVNGANGVGRTNISTMDDGTVVDYNSMTNLDAHVNVHQNDQIGTPLAAQGNIGVNAQ